MRSVELEMPSIFSRACYFHRLAWSGWRENVRMFTSNIIGEEYVRMSGKLVCPRHNSRLFFFPKIILSICFLSAQNLPICLCQSSIHPVQFHQLGI